MPDTVDIDALVMKARATAIELNDLLSSLRKAGCWVSVLMPSIFEPQNAGMVPDLGRVRLTVVFPCDKKDQW